MAAGWAVVTGAASGLGLAFARQLSETCNLLLIDLQEAGLDAVHRELAPGRHQTITAAGDVSNAATWERGRTLLAGATPEWLVQCAGIAVSGRVADAPIGYWRRAMEVNFLGVVLGCQAFAAAMAQTKGSHVINIASRAAFTALPGFGPYGVSKAAVVAFSETLHNEIGESVSITVACPSYFRSNLADRMVAQRELERTTLERRVSSSSRSADDMAREIIKAALRGNLYFFPAGEDRWMWRLKRLMPLKVLGIVRRKTQQALAASVREGIS